MEKKAISGSVGLASVLEALVDSIAAAQRAADIATIEQFFEVGLSGTDEKMSEVRTVDILSYSPDDNGDAIKSMLKVPLISIAPPSHLRIKSAEVSLRFRATTLEPTRAIGKIRKAISKEPIVIKGFVVKQEVGQSEQSADPNGALGDIFIKLVIDSPPVSDALGNLIDQIGNSRKVSAK